MKHELLREESEILEDLFVPVEASNLFSLLISQPLSPPFQPFTEIHLFSQNQYLKGVMYTAKL